MHMVVNTVLSRSRIKSYHLSNVLVAEITLLIELQCQLLLLLKLGLVLGGSDLTLLFRLFGGVFFPATLEWSM
jgi:hypothetical protein